MLARLAALTSTPPCGASACETTQRLGSPLRCVDCYCCRRAPPCTRRTECISRSILLILRLYVHQRGLPATAGRQERRDAREAVVVRSHHQCAEARLYTQRRRSGGKMDQQGIARCLWHSCGTDTDGTAGLAPAQAATMAALSRARGFLFPLSGLQAGQLAGPRFDPLVEQLVETNALA